MQCFGSLNNVQVAQEWCKSAITKLKNLPVGNTATAHSHGRLRSCHCCSSCCHGFPTAWYILQWVQWHAHCDLNFQCLNSVKNWHTYNIRTNQSNQLIPIDKKHYTCQETLPNTRKTTTQQQKRHSNHSPANVPTAFVPSCSNCGGNARACPHCHQCTSHCCGSCCHVFSMHNASVQWEQSFVFPIWNFKSVQNWHTYNIRTNQPKQSVQINTKHHTCHWSMQNTCKSSKTKKDSFRTLTNVSLQLPLEMWSFSISIFCKDTRKRQSNIVRHNKNTFFPKATSIASRCTHLWGLRSWLGWIFQPAAQFLVHSSNASVNSQIFINQTYYHYKTVQTSLKQQKSHLLYLNFVPFNQLDFTTEARPTTSIRKQEAWSLAQHTAQSIPPNHWPIATTLEPWHSWNDKKGVGKQKFHTRKKNAQRTSMHLFEMKISVFSFCVGVFFCFLSPMWIKATAKTHLKALYFVWIFV